MRRMHTSRIPTTAMNPSSAAVDAPGMHAAAPEAATVKASATATPEATTSATTARVCIIRDQAGSEQNHCCKSSENIAKHDNNPPF